MSRANPKAPDDSSKESGRLPNDARECLFETAFHHSPAMQSVVRAADGVLMEVNETFLNKLGFAREQVIGRTPPELNFWVDPGQLAAYRQELKSKGHVSGYEVRLRARDGRQLTVLLSTHPVDIGGTPHLLSAGVDITVRKETEAKLIESERQLRESEARFSTAFRASPTHMTIARLEDGKFVEVNPAFLEWVGLERDQVVGRSSLELELWVDTNVRADFFERLKRDRVVRDVEVAVRSRRGEIHTLQLSGEIIEINREPHLIVFGLDVTGRKRAEQALRDAEARTRALYESLSAAVMVHDTTGFIQINSASLRLFGATRPEDILGRQPSVFSPPRQPDGEESALAAQRHMARAAAHGVERFEWVARRLDGTEMPVEVTLTALQLQGRPVLQAVVIDLTERKLAEAELQNALAQERELSHLKSEFVSLVSHEFRTPLEIIMSSADNLQRYHHRLEPEKRDQLLRTIHKSVRRMSGMMEEVLVLGRLETDRVTFKPAPLDVHAFCQRVCEEMLSATAQRCPIQLKIEGAVSAPAVGDEAVLRHIFANLLANAVKYSPAGQRVEFHVGRDGEEAVCRVVDRGCGIPSDDQKRLFQAFHRGSNVRQIPGTGLGLLIVQRCVALHSGQVQFASVEGQGTTFTVRLPLFGPSVSPSLTLTPTLSPSSNPEMGDGGESKSKSKSKSKRGRESKSRRERGSRRKP